MARISLVSTSPSSPLSFSSSPSSSSAPSSSPAPSSSSKPSSSSPLSFSSSPMSSPRPPSWTASPSPQKSAADSGFAGFLSSLLSPSLSLFPVFSSFSLFLSPSLPSSSPQSSSPQSSSPQSSSPQSSSPQSSTLPLSPQSSTLPLSPQSSTSSSLSPQSSTSSTPSSRAPPQSSPPSCGKMVVVLPCPASTAAEKCSTGKKFSVEKETEEKKAKSSNRSKSKNSETKTAQAPQKGLFDLDHDAASSKRSVEGPSSRRSSSSSASRTAASKIGAPFQSFLLSQPLFLVLFFSLFQQNEKYFWGVQPCRGSSSPGGSGHADGSSGAGDNLEQIRRILLSAEVRDEDGRKMSGLEAFYKAVGPRMELECHHLPFFEVDDDAVSIARSATTEQRVQAPIPFVYFACWTVFHPRYSFWTEREACADRTCDDREVELYYYGWKNQHRLLTEELVKWWTRAAPSGTFSPCADSGASSGCSSTVQGGAKASPFMRGGGAQEAGSSQADAQGGSSQADAQGGSSQADAQGGSSQADVLEKIQKEKQRLDELFMVRNDPPSPGDILAGFETSGSVVIRIGGMQYIFTAGTNTHQLRPDDTVPTLQESFEHYFYDGSVFCGRGCRERRAARFVAEYLSSVKIPTSLLLDLAEVLASRPLYDCHSLIKYCASSDGVGDGGGGRQSGQHSGGGGAYKGYADAILSAYDAQEAASDFATMQKADASSPFANWSLSYRAGGGHASAGRKPCQVLLRCVRQDSNKKRAPALSIWPKYYDCHYDAARVFPCIPS